MEKDERLLPLPNTDRLQISQQEVPSAYSPFYDDDSFSESRSLREYFVVVYKRLPLILALTILVTAAVAFYMYRQPSEYQAATTVLIEPPKAKPQSKDAININFGNDINYWNTQLKLIQSPDVMRDVVTRLNLYRDPNLFNADTKGFFSSVKSMFSGEKQAQNKESSLPILSDSNDKLTTSTAPALTTEEQGRVEAYAGRLLGNLNVDQQEKTNLVDIKIKSTNPDLSAKVANMVATVFIDRYIRRETQGAEKAYEDLTKSIEDLKATIAEQEQQRIQFMKEFNLSLAEKGQELAASRLQTLSAAELKAEDDRKALQAKFEAAQRANAKGEIYGVSGDNPAIIAARDENRRQKAQLQKDLDDIDNKIKELESDREALRAKYTDEYSEVKKVTAKIDSLNQSKKAKSDEMSKRIETDDKKLESSAAKEVLTGLQSQLEAAQRREEQARSAYSAEFAQATQHGIDSTKLTTLSQEIETNRGLLNTYTQRQKEKELEVSSSRPDNIKISTEATIPNGPIGPNRNRNILVAFLISLAAGIGLAFLLDYLDDSIRSSDDIGRHLGLPTLALIPHQNILGKARALLPSMNGSGVPSMALVALEDTRSPMAEAYRHLRTSLLFSSAGKPPQAILITSSQPSEGKTTTAINTAITLAQAGADVVIIDCDLRRPRLHQHFNMENSTGLTNYLSGERNPDNLLKSFPTLPSLKVVTSGPIPPNPAELLSSNEMRHLLQFLKGNFKHVIIDSPPAISFTDAAILATLVDGVVLVAMAGKSSIHLIRRFKQRLHTIGARIYGVVLNGIKPNSMEYGYYGYSSNYYYAPNDDDSTPMLEEELAAHSTKS
jgi:polysaccharide biosynthesis transport protein